VVSDVYCLPDESAAHTAAADAWKHRQILDLSGDGVLRNELEVPDDFTRILGDQYISVVDINVELCCRVFGNLGQSTKISSRAFVPVDDHS
jgi:hypothetical protein